MCLLLLHLNAVATLSALCQTLHLHTRWREQILAHTCIRSHSQRCRLVFRVQCVSWKIGLKAEPVARQRLCHIRYFFSPCLVLSLTDGIYAVPDIWMLLDVNSYKRLLGPTMLILFNIFLRLLPSLMRHCFFPHVRPWTKASYFPSRHGETHSGTENKRKKNEGKLAKERAQTDKNMLWNFEHVAYTWWLFLFMHAYSLMSHNCRLVLGPTHHSHNTSSQNPWHQKSPCGS